MSHHERWLMHRRHLLATPTMQETKMYPEVFHRSPDSVTKSQNWMATYPDKVGVSWPVELWNAKAEWLQAYLTAFNRCAAWGGLEWFGGASFGFLKLSDLQILQILRCPGWVCNHTWFEEARPGGWESRFEAIDQRYTKRPSGAFYLISSDTDNLTTQPVCFKSEYKLHHSHSFLSWACQTWRFL